MSGSRAKWSELGARSGHVACALAFLLVLAYLVASSCRVATAAARPKGARPPAGKKARAADGCRPQRPKAFLQRSSFVRGGVVDGAAHQRALRWRFERYGHVPGVGGEAYNRQSAPSQSRPARFFGLPLQIHARVEPALRCVERRIRATCTSRRARYVPKAVGGLRSANTYRGGEVSNHLFGIAVDVDPDRNPCCGCVAPWRDHPLCKIPARSVFQRTALTPCWVDAFERYGFYWLGRDALRDTMHFEFLADPDRIRP